MKSYDELLAECNALAAKLALIQSEWVKGNFSTKCISIAALREVIESTPQQCLAEIKAEAAEVAYYNGFKDALVIEPPLPPATCTSATIDVFAYRVDQASRYAASQYAAKIRSTGTWLKDTNVNGGKRQGGEK